MSSLQEAAAVTQSYTVAYLLVNQLANVTRGQTVLLHSAGGAVVSFIVVVKWAA